MTETNGREIPVALYDRLSTLAQAEEGYAQEGHLHELRERMAAMDPPRRIVEEVPDEPGTKRFMHERPGLERVKELARAGRIEECWAWSWTRYGESPVPEVLAVELAEHDVVLRSLDDGGEGLGGEIMRAVRGVLSREEQRERVRRSEMGKRSKVRQGRVLGGGLKPRFGFRRVRDGKGRVVGYEPVPEEMAVVRRIVGWLAEGRSLYFVQTTLEDDGVAAPMGGARWSRDTIKNMVREDSYLAYAPEELAALVAEGLLAEEVFAGLDPERSYGVSFYGRTRSAYVSTRSKKRKVQQVPRSEWVAVPVPLREHAPERGEVEEARRAIADNRASASAGHRFWELSRGILFCAECGRSMAAWAPKGPKKKAGPFYYRCGARHKARGNVPARCPNNKCHRAEQLEYEAALLFEQYADRGTLLELYDRAIAAEEERSGTRAVLERRAALAEKRSELEVERRGYLRQAARGLLTDADLDAMLAEVDEQREAVAAELAAVEERATAAERMRAIRGSLAAGHSPVHAEWNEDPDAILPSEYLTAAARPEEIRRAYRRYGARFEVDREGVLTLRLTLAACVLLESSSA